MKIDDGHVFVFGNIQPHTSIQVLSVILKYST